jgi:hypothetical protein
MKNTIKFLLIIGFLLFGFSCKKDKSTNPADKLYLACYTFNQNNVSIAAYWNNGKLNTVTDQTKESYAGDILVKNGIVYMVGAFDGKPCYWENAKKVDLSENGTVLGEVRTLATFNDKLYLGGYVKVSGSNVYTARFWEIDAAATVSVKLTSLIQGSVNDIAIDANGDVYGVGFEAGKAVYWLNYSLNALGTGSGTATAICIKDGHRYICGTETSPWGTYLGYWKDLDFKPFTEKSTDANLSAIYVDNQGKPFAVGTKTVSNQPKASYWNAEGTIFTIDQNYSDATSVFYTGSTTYIGGQDSDGACYWKDGQLVSLNTANSYVTSIYLAQ